jgi:hypothetical protein
MNWFWLSREKKEAGAGASHGKDGSGAIRTGSGSNWGQPEGLSDSSRWL